MTKIVIFLQKFDCLQRFRFLPKVLILMFDQNGHFRSKFWKFRFLAKIWFSAKISIWTKFLFRQHSYLANIFIWPKLLFGPNFYLAEISIWSTFWFGTENLIFLSKFRFFTKISFLATISIFDQNLDFLTKMSVFNQKSHT